MILVSFMHSLYSAFWEMSVWSHISFQTDDLLRYNSPTVLWSRRKLVMNAFEWCTWCRLWKYYLFYLGYYFVPGRAPRDIKHRFWLFRSFLCCSICLFIPHLTRFGNLIPRLIKFSLFHTVYWEFLCNSYYTNWIQARNVRLNSH